MSYEQSTADVVRVLVGPASRLSAIQALATTGGVALGQALLEPSGVSNRRFAVAHRFNAADAADVDARFVALDRTKFSLLTALPADWRFPLGSV